MASIYSDDQRQSLMDSMTNPQSNAAKFLEQGGETGLSPDITMDILNKYATYGANTGIGNIGGSRLVNALNEEYRKKVGFVFQNHNLFPHLSLKKNITLVLEKTRNKTKAEAEAIALKHLHLLHLDDQISTSI